MVKPFEKTRHWFDIALPRDIDEIEFDDLNIYSVDDLQCIVDENMELRANKAKEAYHIVSLMTKEFFTWLQTLNVEPTIKHVHLKAEEIINKKIQNAIKKHFINEDEKENIKKLCQSVMNEFLHHPTIILKEQSKAIDSDVILTSAQELFGIKESEEC
jgi:glutamyl-tRNA reductase